MEGLKLIPYLFLVIAIAGIIGGASAITLAQFSTTTTNAQALNTIANASSGIGTIAQQLPTVSIIAIMVVIISVIAGVFAYMRYFG